VITVDKSQGSVSSNAIVVGSSNYPLGELFGMVRGVEPGHRKEPTGGRQ